jgi:hypothetical protein
MPSSFEPDLVAPPAPRSRARAALRLVAGALLLGAAALLLYRDRAALPSLATLPPWIVALVFLGRVVGHMARHLGAALALRGFVPALRFVDYLALSSSVALLGRVLPLGAGFVVKALALERAYGIRKVELAAAFGAALALRLVASAAVAALGLFLLVALGSPVSSWLWLLVSVSLAVGLVPFLWRAPLRAVGRLLPMAGRLDAGIATLAREPRRLAAMGSLELARALLGFACAGALLWALAPAPSHFLVGGLMSALTALVRAVPLTPGHVGTHEWMAALIGAATGVELALGLLVTVLGRALGLLAGVVVALGGALLRARARRTAAGG